ncbi:hypothetical protein HZ326_19591 [Fusarium oxysporum f. sp. albedinis]|nr:hypothetical protein HZ326_19591 [Fusarium oxysporum f. sp. albedinis]
MTSCLRSRTPNGPQDLLSVTGGRGPIRKKDWLDIHEPVETGHQEEFASPSLPPPPVFLPLTEALSLSAVSPKSNSLQTFPPPPLSSFALAWT